MKAQQFTMKVGRTVQTKTRAEVARMLRIGKRNADMIRRLRGGGFEIHHLVPHFGRGGDHRKLVFRLTPDLAQLTGRDIEARRFQA